ncbi:TPA: acetyl-CoA carboxylase biotin carboxyl carrier protein subunit [Streptococcus equi subsp. zooepidemicus]|uniref:Acetyl-CoA carboxylase biotin carboxyl carrier protein subunit n=1 Tax=Streptococcus equi subsp. ruminatorum CECT 5772 TaxID=1051981 RepID=A0A922NTQ7_9STRE|nr:acetyl-CoA carboxylase biotin carboxyl carrier protein subunit [Streptococcus equi]HEL0247509.1 acetyl-CoA carboxylase biotin carboxyl carrier protein subunit [Streptococcus equi subsp. zooepidemicus]HEL1012810.1 acetyl-CoA carboxylase biotin carboxyl carrier protein subunit [Streptococcus equi subsp. ruminatorum]KED03891.1 acetyl-CoA carboxylase biotin carboxyl carrier protein subunit [Streptococcus equi subsp. ruminatorum CECT 5772]HEL0620993.1 acetyl-CoA carboxylase biotin carboxyl carrie
MLRKFKITIDGKEYLVEMEEISAPTQAPVAPPVQPATPDPVAEEKVAPQAPAAAPVSAGADAMPSPMPGTILKVLVNVGDVVQENQPLLILEAMKMENEIVASTAGTVTGIHVTTGQVVNPGEGLITIS